MAKKPVGEVSIGKFDILARVKRLVKIPSTWGAKITGEQFEERAKKYLSK